MEVTDVVADWYTTTIMGSSRSFGQYTPVYAHLTRGQSGLNGELNTLRSQVDLAFSSLEQDLGVAQRAAGASPPYVAGHTLSALRAVYVSTGNTVEYAQPSVGYPAGVAITAAQQGASVSVISSGDIEDQSWNWMTGPIFLGADGMLTQQLEGLSVLWVLGGAVSHTHMVVRMSGPFLLG